MPLLALNYTFHLIPIERKFSKGPLAYYKRPISQAPKSDIEN